MKNLLLFLLLYITPILNAISPPVVRWDRITSSSVKNLPRTADGQGIFGDFNNDGNLDFFIIAGQGQGRYALFKGSGDGRFVQVDNDELSGKSQASAAFIDIDNDGNLDLISIGKDDSGIPVTDVFINSGAPDYRFVWNRKLSDNFPYLSLGGESRNPHAIAVFDYNNDGRSDILITGLIADDRVKDNGQTRLVAVFKNNGDGTFERISRPIGGTADFDPVCGGSVDVADYDSDGFQDILVSGYNAFGTGTTSLYRNNGNGTFSKVTNVGFTGQCQGETAFIDINNDGYADILELGRDPNNNWAGFAKLFVNNRNGSFTRYDVKDTNIGGVCFALAVGDVNNDGFIDLLTTGWGSDNKIYYNNGDGKSFLPSTFFLRDGICRQGSACFADINKDGFLDLHVFGYHDDDGNYNSLGYWPDFFALNAGITGVVKANKAPSVPKNCSFYYNEEKGCYDISWDRSTDDTTPQNAIRYNVYVKYPDGKVNCTVPADIASGTLKVAGLQAFIPTNKYSLYIPKTAGIEIGVQAVDNGLMTSAFTRSEPTSVIRLPIENDIDVFTAGNRIRIDNKNSQPAGYRIFSVDGRQIVSGNVDPNDCRSSEELKQGVYFVETRIEKRYAGTRKIVV